MKGAFGTTLFGKLEHTWEKGDAPLSLESQLETDLDRYRTAKIEHKTSAQCDAQHGAGCTGCHFYSGAIAALSEALGEPGVID